MVGIADVSVVPGEMVALAVIRDIIEVAVFLLVAQALVINRLAGLPNPMWNAAASMNPVNED
jgi:hypothetical protein